jgi:AhpC/TSA family
LPHLIDFYEDHKADHDKFEILAFHDAQAKTFDELDKKLVPIIKNVWGGHPLPFPILLDSTGETVEKFGIHAFPTTLLIDPEGRLVGEANEEELEKTLPPVPLAMRVAKALDRNVTVYFKDPTLQEAADMLAKATKVPVTLDPRALNIAGLTPQTRVPLQIAGRLSTRSAFELAFDPYDLTVEAAPEGLTLTHRPNGSVASRTLSKPQETCARRIEERLAQKTSFQLGSTSLEKLAQHFEGETTENFVLDPRGRKTGTIDPKATVTVTAKDEPLGEALNRILRPLSLHLEVRDEVVVIAAKP